MSERLIREMSTEKSKRNLMNKSPEQVTESREENLDTAAADEGNQAELNKPNINAPGGKLEYLNKEKFNTLDEFDLQEKRTYQGESEILYERNDTEKFPFQLNHGAMDPTESFFDFENEKFVNMDEYARVKIFLKNF